MSHASLRRENRRCFANLFLLCVAVLTASLFTARASRAQNAPAHRQTQADQAQTQSPSAQMLQKYPGLSEEFGRLLKKMNGTVQLPNARTESHLLPLLPANTTFLVSIANYGDALHQALGVFHQELQESEVLRNWWAQVQTPATTEPSLDESLEKLAEAQQFLGDEIVISGAMVENKAEILIFAEARKPGFKKFLEQMIAQQPGHGPHDLRVLEPQDLATAKEEAGSDQKLIVLVRPDFVVATEHLKLLRNFNAQLDSRSQAFATAPFGKRLLEEYRDGVTIVAAADLQNLVGHLPTAARQDAAFQQSGFADVKYAIWDHKLVKGESAAQAELSFSQPRHGAAAWLANSAPLSNVDFVSPKAIMALTISLANPPQIFEDIKAMNSGSKNDPFATLAVFEKMLNLSLKDDVLKCLSGEITMELDKFGQGAPEWRLIFKVNDATHLQQTLGKLLATANFQEQSSEEDGVTYYTVRVPSQKGATEIGYAFADGHLIVGSSKQSVADSVQMHHSGESLAKSPRLLAALPPGHTMDASALFYEDASSMIKPILQMMSSQISYDLRNIPVDVKPIVAVVNADDSAIRATNRGGAADAGTILVVAAIAIPNLLRSRMAANEASAVGSMRSINTAQATYSVKYRERHYAADLATLGSDPHHPAIVSPDHAGFLNESLANEACKADGWCTKSGYRFSVRSVCQLQKCTDYVAIAAPTDSNTGVRSFCSTADGVIRQKTATPGPVSLTVSECKEWRPIQ